VLPDLRKEYSPDLIVANGENSAGGLGIDPRCADEIWAAGVDVISSGNHIWKKKTLLPYLEQHEDKLIRPYNFPPSAPGRGWTLWKSHSGYSVAILNLQGRVFMTDLIDCPFRALDDLLAGEAGQADYIFLDFHAEATSEKIALAKYADGRIQMMVGTHTHVQTADERVLANGTAYITDAGMCGPAEGVIGVRADSIVDRFINARPTQFELAKGPAIVNAVFFEVNEQKEILRIERIRREFTP
jgi:hypothetical protein